MSIPTREIVWVLLAAARAEISIKPHALGLPLLDDGYQAFDIGDWRLTFSVEFGRFEYLDIAIAPDHRVWTFADTHEDVLTLLKDIDRQALNNALRKALR